MQFTKTIAAAFAALMFSSGAQAAVLLSASGSPANAAIDYSAPGLVSFNLDLQDLTATRLDFVLQEEDLRGPLSLSAMVLNLSGMPFSHFNFYFQGIGLAGAGSVTPAFGTLGSVKHDADSVGIHFAQAEPAELHFGNPLGLQGQADWVLDTSGLRAGDTFFIVAQVPEPSTVALVLPMLCMAGLMAARRRKKD
ncbi:PEP-CTERM sorting domain-containing protein [Massilia sp. ZL223]|uniref:PEP-CTERM sorting domain-containing protein n=1 Tax=Massilia sp. ZL223 TaxID=2824904 RepID=UPI001B827A2C|nr:PEP-CTERM sorting domain-containing protein [Massilia sp. ZL223]MBQ5962687.1 PEP-CTERM sorting domain-containing protein [Massilia sp. ZL223]